MSGSDFTKSLSASSSVDASMHLAAHRPGSRLPHGRVRRRGGSLVLCSVAEQSPALAGLRRVLKPRGELRFFEHVRAEASCRARVQGALDRFGVWPFLAGGCHCPRETVGAIGAAGFETERLRRFELGPSWVLTSRSCSGSPGLEPSRTPSAA